MTEQEQRELNKLLNIRMRDRTVEQHRRIAELRRSARAESGSYRSQEDSAHRVNIRAERDLDNSVDPIAEALKVWAENGIIDYVKWVQCVRQNVLYSAFVSIRNMASARRSNSVELVMAINSLVNRIRAAYNTSVPI